VPFDAETAGAKATLRVTRRAIVRESARVFGGRHHHYLARVASGAARNE
jgi:hypothetical protein